MTDHDRIQVERQIISACLNGFYLSPVDILQANNFKDPDHRDIFEIVKKYHLTEPINILTVSIRYREAKGPLGVYKLMDIADSYIGGDTAPYCLMLLEIDMRQKFITLLQDYEDSASESEDFESAAFWKQCREHIAFPENEVFTAIENTYKYIHHFRPDEVMEYAELMGNIPKLVDRIKSQTQVRLLVDSLKRQCNTYGHQRETLLNITTDILVALLIRSDLPTHLEPSLHAINREGI
jgi:hypothetical protein